MSVDLYEVCFPLRYTGQYTNQGNAYQAKYDSSSPSYTHKYQVGRKSRQDVLHVSEDATPTPAGSALSTDYYEVNFPLTYAGKYTATSSSYTGKYSTQSNVYVDKYGNVCVD